jgi:hypothetical protein
MHIAYSAIRQAATTTPQTLQLKPAGDDLPEPLLRYNGYQAACQKLNQEIAAIQKYIPGWMPVFR